VDSDPPVNISKKHKIEIEIKAKGAVVKLISRYVSIIIKISARIYGYTI
jgi:hypothetical protein